MKRIILTLGASIVKLLNPTTLRKTAICLGTALAISLPGAASAGFLQNVKNRTQTVVQNVREKRPIANALQNASNNLPGSRLIEMVQELHLKEQLENTIALIQQMNIDYRYFAGGTFGCEAECKAFRKELKEVFEDFLWLVEDLPALNQRTRLIETITRVSDLIDYVPPRALYLMWQALEGRLDELRMAAVQIREMLAALPPLDIVSGIGDIAGMAGTYADNSPVCEWAREGDMPFIELVQAELERIAWALKTIEGLIPDVEVKAEAGAEGGVAVANVTGAAGAGVKPTDSIKIALKAIAVVPEGANWAIKLNILRAKVVCKVAAYAAN